MPSASPGPDTVATLWDPMHYSSVRSLASAIRDGRVSSLEFVEACLARIDAVNPALNAVVQLRADEARADAGRADEAVARGEPVGPLHGVPMTIKDSFCTKEVRTTSGAPELSDHIAENDAVPVARLRGAGAVIFRQDNHPARIRNRFLAIISVSAE